MFEFVIKRQMVCGVVMLAWLLCPSSGVLACDYVATARDFMSAVYPELNGMGYHVRVGFDYFFDKPVSRFPQFWYLIEKSVLVPYAEGKPGLIRKYAPLASANFDFNRFGLINRFQWTTEILNPEKRESFDRLWEQHPEWTVEQVGQELTKAGAQYGPSERDKFSKTVPITALEKFFGKLSVTDLRFDLEYDEQEKHISGTMNWIVTATVKTQTGSELKYIFAFEPFGGKLDHLIKDPLD